MAEPPSSTTSESTGSGVPAGGRSLSILHLEDDLHDRELVRRLLVKNGFLADFTYASSGGEFQQALEQSVFDLILADFTLPGYDGMAALSTALAKCPTVPFLFVSGTIGEEQAIFCLKSGATDYVLKHRLDLLIPAVHRALREAAERTRRQEAEEALRQAQKMDSIGQLAGGIAHDFNNALTVINGHVYLLLDREDLSPDTLQSLREVFAAGEHAARLTRQLLLFSRKQPIKTQVLNLNEVIQDTTQMLRRLVGTNVTVELELSSPPPWVLADFGMLEQILVNLTVNARDAMPDGGKLRIASQTLTISADVDKPAPEAASGEFVCLTVQDDGCGIAPDILPRIFEPFFTTKDVGKGTGLGLATVYAIVNQHHGWVEVKSQVRLGTEFKIFLPLTKNPVAESGLKSSPEKISGGTETVLLVEDETPVRELAAAVLRRLGYRVLQAASGKEALEVWQWHAPRISLLLTDIVMPDDLTGVELAKILCAQKPALKVIFASGYSEAHEEQPLPPEVKTLHLQKPYHPKTLAKALRDLLDG